LSIEWIGAPSRAARPGGTPIEIDDHRDTLVTLLRAAADRNRRRAVASARDNFAGTSPWLDSGRGLRRDEHEQLAVRRNPYMVFLLFRFIG